jgi:hypothetical protein
MMYSHYVQYWSGLKLGVRVRRGSLDKINPF